MKYLRPRRPRPSMAELRTVQPICIIDGLLCPLAAMRDGKSQPGEPCDRSCALPFQEK